MILSSLLLILLITSVYAPFLGFRLIRMAGDEKVYISQALEMARDGHWFIQTLQDVPNYYKGPLHYLLLRFGMIVFGKNPWAVLYMNFFLVTLGALALAAIVRKRIPEWKGGDVWTGAAFALGAGIYAHVFASQMEVEIAALIAIALYLLDRTDVKKGAFGFWAVAGVIGWAKSPLHSVLIGTSALLFWTLRGEILQRMFNWRSWLGALSGVAIAVAGYLPAFLLDRSNLINTYWIRETLSKGGSGQPWTVSIESAFGFYLFPWVLVALVAYAQLLFSPTRGLLGILNDARTRRVFLLGVSGFAPSVAFFAWHPYHFENYNLPVIAGIWLMLASIFGSLALHREKLGAKLWRWLYSAAIGLTAIAFLILPIGLSALAVRFSPLPAWWPIWLLPFVWIATLVSVMGFIKYGVLERGARSHWLAFSSAGILWALGALFVVVGEREMLDLKTYLHASKASGRKIELGYYNLNHNIWSEWGYLNFWIPHEVHGIHEPARLIDAMKNGETILVTSKENGIQEFKDFAAKNLPALPLHFIPWKRWLTRGQSSDGRPLWRVAWDSRDLSALETDYVIVETRR